MEAFYIILFSLISFAIGFTIDKFKVLINISITKQSNNGGILIKQEELKELIKIIRKLIEEHYPYLVTHINYIKIDYCTKDSLYLYIYCNNIMLFTEEIITELQKEVKEVSNKFTIINTVEKSYLITNKNNEICSEI